MDFADKMMDQKIANVIDKYKQLDQQIKELEPFEAMYKQKEKHVQELKLSIERKQNEILYLKNMM